MKPILNKQLEEHIDDILAPFKDPERWQAMGLSFSPVANAVLLLTGEPGTGKTTLARYMAKRVSERKLIEISFGEMANDHLGKTEEHIIKAFKDAEDSPCVFLDECDAILWDRARVTDNSIYMLSVVNTLLIELDKFIKRGGFICMTTNHPEILDPAIKRRVTDFIHLEPPTGEEALRFWRSKLPKSVKLSKEEAHELMQLKYTPANMETAILRAARRSFRSGKEFIVQQIIDEANENNHS